MPSRSKALSLVLLGTATAAAAAASSAGDAPSVGGSSIYSAKFTSVPVEEDILSTIDRCETDLSCAGVSFEPNGTVTKTKLYHHSFVGPYRTDKTYETSKPFTYHRGRITGGNVASVEEDISLADAKARCSDLEGCAAFTYPVRSLVGLLTLRNVTFFSSLDDFERDDTDNWRSYVSNDPSRADNVNAESLEYDEDVVERPYRSCCDTEAVPEMEEVVKADALERISCDISREEFFLRYEVPRKPVMLVGCERDWPAVTESKWLAENLAPRFSNSTRWRARIGGTKKLKSEDYNHRVAWGDIAEAMLTNKPYYLFDQLYDPEAKDIDNDYSDPKPVAGGDLYAKLPHFAGPLRWFCHGPPGTGTQSHMDPFGTDAWNTLIKGHKWWLIYPPGFTDNSQLECEPSCSVKVPLVSHWYASVGINGARTEFPLDGYAVHVLQRPGETIYVPDGLLHSVYNYDDTIAITKNYASAANLDNVWMETVTDGDPEKWRAMYYHTLNREQRRRVRRSPYWPPQRWERRSEECLSGPGDMMEEFPMFDIDHDWEFREGELVEALLGGGSFEEEEDDEWNVGRITAILDDGDYMIEYNDGDTDRLSFEHLRRLPQEGDVVEAQYNGHYNEWYRATVTAVGFDGTFDVEYDDGDTDEGLQRGAVREYVPPHDDEIVQVMWIDEDGDEEQEEYWVDSVIAGDENSDGTYNVEHYDGEEMEEVHPSHVRRMRLEFDVGDEVAAEIEFDGEAGWYRGVVARARMNGRYDVKLDNGDEGDCITWRAIRPLWASGGVLGLDEDEGEGEGEDGEDYEEE